VRLKTCPLCGEIAGYKDSSLAIENKCYYCKQCVNFIISQPAEEIILKYPKEKRLSFSVKSKKSFVCQVLVIDTAEAGGQESIDFKYEPESKWY
jgi:hypothetical protein